MSAPTARHTIQGSFLVALAEGLALPTGLLTAIVLTRSLGTSGYGLFTLATALVAWIQWSVVAIFGRATVKLIGSTNEWQPLAAAVLRLHAYVSTALAAILVVSAGLLAGMLHEPDLAHLLRVYALDIVVFSIAHGYRAVLIGAGHFRRRALSSAARWVGRLVLIVLFVQLGFGIEGAIWGNIGGSLLELLFNRHRSGVRFWHGAAPAIPGLWRLAAPITISALLLRVFDRLDLFMLKFLGGTAAQAGIYGAAQNLALAPSVVAIAISPLMLSSISRALRDHDQSGATATARWCLRAIALLLPFAGVAAGNAFEIVHLVFGPAFAPAAPVFAILIFGAFAAVWISAFTAILIATGRAAWALKLAAPMVPCAALGHLVLIPALGLRGAAISTAVVAIAAAFACAFAVKAGCGMGPPAGSIARGALVGVILGSMSASWRSAGPAVLAELTLLSSAVPLLFFAFGEVSRAERLRLLVFIRRRIYREPTISAPSKEE